MSYADDVAKRFDELVDKEIPILCYSEDGSFRDRMVLEAREKIKLFILTEIS